MRRLEQTVQSDPGMPYTIFRPSVIFGPGDEFINTLGQSRVQSAPIIPVVGAGTSKFQPVAARDVADAFVAAIDDPASENQVYRARRTGYPDL